VTRVTSGRGDGGKHLIYKRKISENLAGNFSHFDIESKIRAQEMAGSLPHLPAATWSVA
jgi:hypothetical protein